MGARTSGDRRPVLAYSLALGLCIELTLYIVIGVALARFTAMSIGVISLSALAVALALRLVIVSASFAEAARYRAKLRPALGVFKQARLFAAEFAAFVALFTLLQPLDPWLARPRRATRGCALGLPVVLLHGIYCNGAAWWWMVRRLRRHVSVDIFTPSLRPLFASIDELASELAQELERVCAATGAQQVVLVGHSMGGLVARAYLKHLHGHRIAKLITLASPHHGSELARWAHPRQGAQLRPASPWLEALNRAEPGPPDPPTVSIFSRHDNFVAPQDSPTLANATNIALIGIGHLEMFFSKRVARLLDQEIKSAIPTPCCRRRVSDAAGPQVPC